MKRALVIAVALSLMTAGCGLLKKRKAATTDDDPSTLGSATATIGGTGAKNEKDILRYANEAAVADVPASVSKDGTKVKTFPQTGADVATVNRGAAVVEKAKFFSTGVLVLFNDPTTNDGTKLLGWVAPEALSTSPLAASAATATATVIATAPKPSATATAPSPSSITFPLVAGKCPRDFTAIGAICKRACLRDPDCPSGSFCSGLPGTKKICAPR